MGTVFCAYAEKTTINAAPAELGAAFLWAAKSSNDFVFKVQGTQQNTDQYA